jgi:hypothetical protein
MAGFPRHMAGVQKNCRYLFSPFVRAREPMTGWFAPSIFHMPHCMENEVRQQAELLKAENEILR